MPKESHAQAYEERNVVLLIEDQEGIHILVDPEWQGKVSTSDQDFIGELISDFAQRAKSEPANLLEQTRFLGVGPVVTRAEGALPTDDPLIVDTMQRFVKFETK